MTLNLSIPLEQTDWLAERAKITPSALALIFGEMKWTYEELDQWVNQLCHQIVGSGKAANTYATLLNNKPIAIAAIHALARLGSVALPLNTRLTPEELAWQFENNQPACQLLFTEAFQEQATTLDNNTAINLDTLNSEKSDSVYPKFVSERNSIQGRFYTSGTTGQAKAAMLSFANYAHSANASAQRLGMETNDRWLLAMPLYHIGGQSIIFRACIAGIPIVLQDGFDPDQVYASIMEDKVTIISLVPTMLHRMMLLFQDHGVPKALRVVLLGGAAPDPTLLQEALDLNIPIALTYGLTEATSQVATATPLGVRQKPGSVGKALDGTHIKIIGSGGELAPTNISGEIVISGPTLMQGYYNNPQATAKALKQGDLYTGDLGYLDDDGDLWILSRRDDLIVSGGENVYPAEVERVLLSHPSIDEAAVFGLPNSEWGQQVAAAITTTTPVNAQTIMAYCREYLGGYKIPRKIFFLTELPKTASGKIKRRAIAASISKEVSK